ARFAAFAATAVLFTGAAFPSWFSGRQRDLETFFERSKDALGTEIEGEKIADCIHLPIWRGGLLLRFDLRASAGPGSRTGLRNKLVDLSGYVFEAGEKIRFSSEPFAIVYDSEEATSK